MIHKYLIKSYDISSCVVDNIGTIQLKKISPYDLNLDLLDFFYEIPHPKKAQF